jgi:2-polyprenyl-6-methoxyphenol hydroxylase-like FAD-dependent oxidoreductase
MNQHQGTVLISGAGIAGPTLAHWLARLGFRPTVVERAVAPRSSGSPVDVREQAVAVAERMGVMSRIREAGTDVTEISFVDGDGRQVGRIDTGALRRAARSREVEVPRSDLARILWESCRDDVEFLFDDTIVSLDQDQAGVDVAFQHAPPRRFDLVVGADGLHSTVRRLAFGPESRYVRHLDVYVATLPLPGAAAHRRTVVMHNTPGRAVAVHPSTGGAIAAFMFRGPARPDFDHRDLAQHKRLLADAYAGGAWRVPELLDRVRDADDLYFDSVSQVELDRWRHGRIALLGDAASCVSLFGDGCSLSMAGAYTLAGALAEHPGDHAAALAGYESAHRLLVTPKQRGVEQAAALLIPATRRGVTARNLATRLWPLEAARIRLLRPLRSGPDAFAGAAGAAAGAAAGVAADAGSARG